MPYLDTNTKSVSPVANERQQPLGRFPVLNGLFIGFIKDASDVQKNGRLRVWIPELGTAPDEQQGWITVNYCSPFAGATNVETISKANVSQFEGTQTSYGLWMIPPDINNQVLIMFVNGDSSKGIWIGCLYNQFMNNMVPGQAADTNNYQYPGKNVPVAEYNKWDTKVTLPDKATKPYESTKFKGIGNQGLLTDQYRGTTTSSARRESPSNVFGILTPGPVIEQTDKSTGIRRKGGSSFIMDDGANSEYVQLTTKSGAQIKLDETNGFVYLINRDGTAWVEMDQQGNINIFGATNISMRSQQDFNIRADRNVNIEAGQNVFIKAAKDTTQSTTPFTYDVNNIPRSSNVPYWKNVGEGNGQGGNIILQSLNNMHTTVENNSYLTVKENNLNIQVQNDIIVTSIAGSHEYNSGADIDLQADGNLNIKIAGDTFQSANNINFTASTDYKISATTVDVTTNNQFLLSSTVIGLTGEGTITGGLGITGQLKVQSGALLAAPVVLGGTVPVPPADTPELPDPAGDAIVAVPAEIKQMVDKVNILPTWSDPESKFKRLSEAIQTTVSTLPTFEPCPEHQTFTFNAITGYTPKQTEASKTYEGSGGAGNEASASPPTNTDPGANNTDIPPTSAEQNAVTKGINMKAYECQLKIHEGIKYVSYLDSVGLLTGGIGHLLRANEVTMYPLGTVIPASQVSTWFQQDSVISILGAQRLLGVDVWSELTDIRKRACADLCYNLGERKFSKFVKFLAAMKSADYNLAGQSLRNSKWFTQVARRGPNIISMITQNIDPNGCDLKFPQ